MNPVNFDQHTGDQHPENIFDTIRALMEQLPRKQKKLCRYIIESYQSAGLLTVKELAEAAGVGTTTVMRLVHSLGYSSYISMRKAIHKAALESPPNIWWTMEESFKRGNADAGNLLPQVWKEIQYILDRTLDADLQEKITQAVDLLLDAGAINILGLRSSRPIADYFHYILEQFFPKRVNQFSFDSEIIFDRILRSKPDEVLFVITFHPYSNKTIEAAQFSHNRGNRIVLLTDYMTCPIAKFADLVLRTEPSRLQYSIVPAIAVLETVIIELGRRTYSDSIQSLKELDAVLRERKINFIG